MANLGFVCASGDGIAGQTCPNCKKKIEEGERIRYMARSDEYRHASCARGKKKSPGFIAAKLRK